MCVLLHAPCSYEWAHSFELLSKFCLPDGWGKRTWQGAVRKTRISTWADSVSASSSFCNANCWKQTRYSLLCRLLRVHICCTFRVPCDHPIQGTTAAYGRPGFACLTVSATTPTNIVRRDLSGGAHLDSKKSRCLDGAIIYSQKDFHWSNNPPDTHSFVATLRNICALKFYKMPLS